MVYAEPSWFHVCTRNQGVCCGVTIAVSGSAAALAVGGVRDYILDSGVRTHRMHPAVQVLRRWHRDLTLDPTRRYMRVLCIGPLFAPLADSEAICAGKVVNGLLARGIDTDIISFQELDAMPPERRDRSRMWDGRHSANRAAAVEPAEEDHSVERLTVLVTARSRMPLR